MKVLSIEQMESITGGNDCSVLGTIGKGLFIAGTALSVGALLATNPWLVAGLAGGAMSVRIAGGTLAVANGICNIV